MVELKREKPERVIREILSRKDPMGYYVILARNTMETTEALKHVQQGDLLVEYAGDTVIIKSRSRRVAELLSRELYSKGVLVTSI